MQNERPKKIRDKEVRVKNGQKDLKSNFWQFVIIEFRLHAYPRPDAYQNLRNIPSKMLIKDHMINRDSRVPLMSENTLILASSFYGLAARQTIVLLIESRIFIHWCQLSDIHL